MTMPPVASPDLAALGQFVRERRTALNLTQTQLAERLGWKQMRVSVLEHGKYGMPSLRVLAALAVALELSLLDLINACGYGEYLEAPSMRGEPRMTGERMEEVLSACLPA